MFTLLTYKYLSLDFKAILSSWFKFKGKHSQTLKHFSVQILDPSLLNCKTRFKCQERVKETCKEILITVTLTKREVMMMMMMMITTPTMIINNFICTNNLQRTIIIKASYPGCCHLYLGYVEKGSLPQTVYGQLIFL